MAGLDWKDPWPWGQEWGARQELGGLGADRGRGAEQGAGVEAGRDQPEMPGVGSWDLGTVVTLTAGRVAPVGRCLGA